MGLRRGLNAAHRHAHTHPFARTLVAVLLVAAVVACGAGFRAASAAAASVVNVRQYGAVGNGSHNDASAIQRAVNKAASRPGSTVLVPRGVYLCTTPIRLANHVNLRGAGSTASWLEGRLEFGSSSSISKLTIGRPGTCALTHRPGATRTSIISCRLRGGGSSGNADGCVVYLGGSQGNVSRILFTHCQIERTSYVPRAGVDAFARGVGNTITINEVSYLPHGAHVARITFRDCHLGASNGHATGALRMMMEAYCWSNNTGRSYHGWKHLTFAGCKIEASDTTDLDFADGLLSSGSKHHSSSGVLVTGCTFLGAHRDLNSRYSGLPIVYECPTGIVIRHNMFYASPHDAIAGSSVLTSTNAPSLLIQGNTFDMTRSPIGLKHLRDQPCISLVGYDSRVLHNRFLYDTGEGIQIRGSGGGSRATVGNLVQGNIFTDKRSSDGQPTIELCDSRGLGCYNNRIVGNTIRNRAAGRSGVIAQTSGSGTNYAKNNTIHRGSGVAFVVRRGKIVRAGNRIGA